jgi:hypothetical protein
MFYLRFCIMMDFHSLLDEWLMYYFESFFFFEEATDVTEQKQTSVFL